MCIWAYDVLQCLEFEAQYCNFGLINNQIVLSSRQAFWAYVNYVSTESRFLKLKIFLSINILWFLTEFMEALLLIFLLLFILKLCIQLNIKWIIEAIISVIMQSRVIFFPINWIHWNTLSLVHFKVNYICVCYFYVMQFQHQNLM